MDKSVIDDFYVVSLYDALCHGKKITSDENFNFLARYKKGKYLRVYLKQIQGLHMTRQNKSVYCEFSGGIRLYVRLVQEPSGAWDDTCVRPKLEIMYKNDSIVKLSNRILKNYRIES